MGLHVQWMYAWREGGREGGRDGVCADRGIFRSSVATLSGMGFASCVPASDTAVMLPWNRQVLAASDPQEGKQRVQ